MLQDVIAFLAGMVGLAINCVTMLLAFPRKKSMRFTVCVLVLFTIIFYAVNFLLGDIAPGNDFLAGLAYLPVMVWLIKGQFFQKIFAFFFQFFALILQVSLAGLISGAFVGDGEKVSFAVYIVILLLMHTAYSIAVFKYGRRIFERLFASDQPAEWAVYSLGAVFSFAVLTATKLAPGSVWHIGLVLLFIGWSFVILCFAIISTHEKSRQKYEADMAREIVLSGRGYYDKLTEITENLHLLRHDYKHHLTLMQKLMDSGHDTDAKDYLIRLNEKTLDDTIHDYCSNRALNALLDSFAERCERESIFFSVKIILPPAETIDDYELCVILGNLLETRSPPAGVRRRTGGGISGCQCARAGINTVSRRKTAMTAFWIMKARSFSARKRTAVWASTASSRWPNATTANMFRCGTLRNSVRLW